MCSVYDMYMNVARGKVGQNDSVAKSWVYMQSWKEPAAGSSSAGNGGVRQLRQLHHGCCDGLLGHCGGVDCA